MMNCQRVFGVSLCFSLLLAASLNAQSPAPPAEPAQESSSLAPATNDDKPKLPPAKPSFRSLPKDLLLDQRNIWLAPLQLNRRQSKELMLAGAITGGVISFDHFVGDAVSSGPPGDAHVVANGFGRYSGGEYDLVVAGGFYAFGLLARNERARATGVLGTRAVLNAMLLAGGLKNITQRQRPSRPDGWALDDAEGEFFEGGHSFPSGHAMQAWSLATVVAHQYRHRRWAPWLAYGMATAVSISRVPARKHFPSDVLVGSALGFLVGRYVWKSAQPDAPLAERKWMAVPYVPAGGGAGFSLSFSF